MRPLLTAFVLLTAVPQTVAAQSADVLLNCSNCHTLQSDSVPSPYPVLNGQPARYIERQLQAYRNGLRAHPQMQQTATALGEGAGAMARLYADAPVPDLQLRAEPSSQALSLIEDGDWSRGLPPCASCHGMSKDDEMRIAPRLHGQPGGYLAAQLRAYADGSRRSDPMGRMRAFSQRLSSEEIGTLADYYEAWRPSVETQEDRPDG